MVSANPGWATTGTKGKLSGIRRRQWGIGMPRCSSRPKGMRAGGRPTEHLDLHVEQREHPAAPRLDPARPLSFPDPYWRPPFRSIYL